MGLEIDKNGELVRHPSTSPAQTTNATPASTRFGSPILAVEPWTGARPANANESVSLKQSQSRLRRRANQKAKPSYFDSEDSAHSDGNVKLSGHSTQGHKKNPSASFKPLTEDVFSVSDTNDLSLTSPSILQPKEPARVPSLRGFAQRLLDSSPSKSRRKYQANAFSPSASGGPDDVVVPATFEDGDESVDDAHTEEVVPKTKNAIPACHQSRRLSDVSSNNREFTIRGLSQPRRNQDPTVWSPVPVHTEGVSKGEPAEVIENVKDGAKKSAKTKKRTLSFLSLPNSTNSNPDTSSKRPKLFQAMRGISMLETDHKVQSATPVTSTTTTARRNNKVTLSALELEDESINDGVNADVFDHANIPASGGQSPPTAQSKRRSTRNTKPKKAPVPRTARRARKSKLRIAKAKGKSNKKAQASGATESSGESIAENTLKVDEDTTLVAAGVTMAPANVPEKSGDVLLCSPSNLNLKSTEDIVAPLSDFGDDLADSFDSSMLEVTIADTGTVDFAKRPPYTPKESGNVQVQDEKIEAKAEQRMSTLFQCEMPPPTKAMHILIDDSNSDSSVIDNDISVKKAEDGFRDEGLVSHGHMRTCQHQINKQPECTVEPKMLTMNLAHVAHPFLDTAPDETSKEAQPNIGMKYWEKNINNQGSFMALAHADNSAILTDTKVASHDDGLQENKPSKVMPSPKLAIKSSRRQRRTPTAPSDDVPPAQDPSVPLDDMGNIEVKTLRANAFRSPSKRTTNQSRGLRKPDDKAQAPKLRVSSEPEQQVFTGPENTQHIRLRQHGGRTSQPTKGEQTGVAMAAGKHTRDFTHHGIINPSRATVNFYARNTEMNMNQNPQPPLRDPSRSRNSEFQRLKLNFAQNAEKKSSQFLLAVGGGSRAAADTQTDKSSQQPLRNSAIDDTRNRFYIPISSAHEGHLFDQVSANQEVQFDSAVMRRLRCASSSRRETSKYQQPLITQMNGSVGISVQHRLLEVPRNREVSPEDRYKTATRFGQSPETDVSSFARVNHSFRPPAAHEHQDRPCVYEHMYERAKVDEHSARDSHMSNLGALMHRIVEVSTSIPYSTTSPNKLLISFITGHFARIEQASRPNT
ncbi:hypothetical protein BD289DRAFT_183707 [Coniella lustricola]|uniref:Uncharacterized protein n=1 Tax=Coniella lustricola TaxID=2025994 RepID=A0A2T3AD69_9PEZI|nr:hypothetical protein BD289DRAFT_183707 [Coniella lustricola]